MTGRPSVAQRILDAMDIPAESLLDAPRITISGSSRVLIEGHHGLLELGEDRIAAAGKGCKILVKGEGLGLVTMTDKELVIAGRLWAVELE